MRQLRHHEKKLLKKVDFLHYKRETNVRELHVMRQYHIQDRGDYSKYNRLVGRIHHLSSRLKQLDPKDPFRMKMTDQLLEKLYQMGLINTKKSLQKVDNIKVATLCRRRLPVVMVRMKFAESVRDATTMIEQGHVRVGPEVVTDPAFFVTRNMEDHVAWLDDSKIKRHVARYNDRVDDYDLLQA